MSFAIFESSVKSVAEAWLIILNPDHFNLRLRNAEGFGFEELTVVSKDLNQGFVNLIMHLLRKSFSFLVVGFFNRKYRGYTEW